MQTNLFQWTAALGATAVIIGAFGAHGLKPHLSPYQLEIFEKGVQYQFVHTLALFGTALLLSQQVTNNLLRSNFAFHNLAHHAEVLPIVPEFAERVRLFDTEKIPYVIEEGARATEEQIPYLRRLLASETAASGSSS